MRFRIVSVGQQIDSVPDHEQIIQGNSLKPLSPVHLTGTRNDAGDLLIQWVRRDSHSLDMRPYAGTAMSEEVEIFILEIYSGSTLKRRVRVPAIRRTSDPVSWRSWGFQAGAGGSGLATSADDGTATFSGINDVLISTERMNGDFILRLQANASNERIPNNTIVQTRDTELTSTRPLIALVRASNNTNAQASITDGDQGYNIDMTYPNVLYLSRVDGEIKGFLNDIAPAATPYFISSMNFPGELSVVTFNSAAFSAELYQPRFEFSKSRQFRYTVLMQEEDFGSAQSLIKVRVAQESAIVGPGYFAEAIL